MTPEERKIDELGDILLTLFHSYDARGNDLAIDSAKGEAMNIQERLDQYGNYSTVKPDWDKFDGAEQFEVVGGNAILRDQAAQAIEKDIDEIIRSLDQHGYVQSNGLRDEFVNVKELRLKLADYFKKDTL